MFVEGLYNLLAGDPGLNALVNGRISGLQLQSDCVPALTYQIVGGSSDPTFTTSGLQKVRVQFDAFAASYIAAAQVRDAVRILLNGYQGALSDGTFIQNADLIQNIDFFENDARQYRCASEFYFYFTFSS